MVRCGGNCEVWLFVFGELESCGFSFMEVIEGGGEW